MKTVRILFLLLFVLLVSCDTNKNKSSYDSSVENDTLQSIILLEAIPYRVYLPKTNNKPHYLIYLLHGHGGSDDDWFNKSEGNIKQLLDSLITLKMIPPVVAITLDAGNSWYVNRRRQMESMYINEFIPHIESKYSAILEQPQRIIAGNSAGGFGALRFSLEYPELFQSSILLSPAAYYPTPPQLSSSRKINVFTKNEVFNDSIWKSYSYGNIVDVSTRNFPKFYVSTGDDDEYEIFTVVDQLRDFFIGNSISNEVTVINGGHTWEVWRDRFVNDIIRIFNE